MIVLDLGKLTVLEQNIHRTILAAGQSGEKLTINKAAELSGCSVSKITKFIQKAGFKTYKQYIGYICGDDIIPKPSSNELERLKHFLEDFDMSLVDEFISMVRKHNKIILFGYGPSFICAQYLEYKLRVVTNNIVIAVPDENTAMSLLDETSLFVIFSTTGQFRPFQHIYNYAKEKGSEVLLVVEEYNTTLLSGYDKIMYLTQSFQDKSLRPYDKSRSIFFIFIEEIIRKLLEEADSQ